MTWRTVAISSPAKLDLKLNSMVVRGDGLKKIHLSELSTLIIENTAISLTAALLCELSKRKIKVVFCDERRNPYGELIPYYNSHDSTEKLRQQIAWNQNIKEAVWTEIVRQKINNQRDVLSRHCPEKEILLTGYLDELENNDATNREGHAAKVYFNSLFGMNFSRRDDNVTNACLNYGYSIILSAVNREITASGFYTQLGIFHDNTFNHFNLGSDLMEPFRPLVDELVLSLAPESLNPTMKRVLIDILNRQVVIDGKNNYLNNALKIYCKSVLDALTEDDLALIKHCEL